MSFVLLRIPIPLWVSLSYASLKRRTPLVSSNAFALSPLLSRALPSHYAVCVASLLFDLSMRLRCNVWNVNSSWDTVREIGPCMSPHTTISPSNFPLLQRLSRLGAHSGRRKVLSSTWSLSRTQILLISLGRCSSYGKVIIVSKHGGGMSTITMPMRETGIYRLIASSLTPEDIRVSSSMPWAT